VSVYSRVRDFLSRDLERFEAELSRLLKAQKGYLTDAELELYKRGKKLRPILLYLSTRINTRIEGDTCELSHKAIMAGVSLEMLHVASLIHDDVIDMASTRRGLSTINAVRGNELALLIGDLQFLEAARAFASFVKTDHEVDLLRQYLDAGYGLCKGQMDELLSEPGMSAASLLKRYFRTIDRKTGRLIAFACEGGARLAEGTQANVSAMQRFGMHLGRAFQIMDDVLDLLHTEEASGKPMYQDVLQRRLSLPVILQLESLPADHVLWRHFQGEDVPEWEIKEAGARLSGSEAMFKSYSQARIEVEEGKEALFFLPSCMAKDMLIELSEHIVNQGFLKSSEKRREWSSDKDDRILTT